MSDNPCPPRAPPVCPQTATPPPPPKVCYGKPIMKGLHWAQTTRILTQAIALSCFAGTCVYIFLKRARIETYRDFYLKAELEDWADEMARKGLFQAVPSTVLKDKFAK